MSASSRCSPSGPASDSLSQITGCSVTMLLTVYAQDTDTDLVKAMELREAVDTVMLDTADPDLADCVVP